VRLLRLVGAIHHSGPRRHQHDCPIVLTMPGPVRDFVRPPRSRRHGSARCEPSSSSPNTAAPGITSPGSNGKSARRAEPSARLAAEDKKQDQNDDDERDEAATDIHRDYLLPENLSSARKVNCACPTFRALRTARVQLVDVMNVDAFDVLDGWLRGVSKG